MGSLRSGVTQEGALYELVSRGNKDVFFFEDEFKSVSPFDTRYKFTPATLHEVRRIPPLNASDFGRSSEFEFEIAGDLFVDPTLVIDLPSWIPSNYLASIPKSICTDSAGVSYGYTSGIAYFLFKNIQIYQDQILLQEFSGDALFAAKRSRGSLNSAFLDFARTNTHQGSALEISRSAVPGRLRLQLPVVGCQHPDDGGFPSFGIRSQTYKLRITLRKLEDLIEASDGRAKPVPWDRSDFIIKTSRTSSPVPFSTLTRTEIGPPTIQLETRHIYVDHETQGKLKKSKLEIPFSRIYENTFTFGPKDYDPLTKQAIASCTRTIDATHPASRLLFWFITQSALNANQYSRYLNPVGTGEFYNTLALYIAGRDRETEFSPIIWNQLQMLAKEERYPGGGLGVMNWGLGDLRGERQPAKQPDGTLNFSTADRPTLYVNLADPGENSTQLKVVVDSWAMYEVEKGRGSLRYAN